MNVKKKTMGILFLLLLFVAHTYAQRISVNYKEQPLKSVFSDLKTKTGYDFVYQKSTLVNAHLITLTMNDVTLQEVLDRVFYRTNLEYEIVKKGVIIRPRQKSTRPFKRTIRGVVYDDEGGTLPGANVLIKGTRNGAICDLNGRFSITVDSHNPILVFSNVGMKEKELLVTEKTGTSVTVILQSDINVLNDVVVTGYQTISRERSTGAACIIKKDKLDEVVATNLSDKMEGIAPGLMNYNGAMNIRGISSFSINSTPLLVLDGQPVTGVSIDELNPNDIESVTVLKDAAATSLYGVRASNGVIVLTTKKGTSKKVNINVAANFYINPLPSLSYQHYASTSDIIDYEKDYLLNNPTYIENPLGYFTNLNSKDSPQYMTQVDRLYYQLAKGEITESQLDGSLNTLRSRDYRKEYRDALQQMAFTQDYNFSISKANDNSNVFMSGRYENYGSNNKGDKSDKFSFYLKNEFNLTEWFNLGIGANISISNSKYCQAPYQGATTAMPYDTLYNEDGSYAYFYPYNYENAQEINNTSGLKFMGYNAIEEYSKNKSKTDDVYWKLFTHADFKIIDGLKFGIKFQYEKRNQNSERYDEEDSYYMRELINRFAVTNSYGGFDYYIPQGGHLGDTHSKWSYLNLRAQFDYAKTIKDKHDITLLLGGEIREDKYRRTGGDRYGYDDERLTSSQVDWETLSQQGVIGQLSNTANTMSEVLQVYDTHHRYVSAYFNAGYSYDSKYSFNASVRIEQADLFGTDPKYRYRPLWSVGASWNVSNETFMKKYAWLNMLKLRATYGITGNVDQSSSPYLLGTYLTSVYSGANLTDIITPPNKMLRWEKTSTFNIGLDFVIMNRLNANIDFYKRYSSDLLANKSLDPSTGFEQARVNNGAMKNTGLELGLSYDWIKTRDWAFTTGFTASYNKNKIDKVNYTPTDAIDMMKNPTSYYLKGDTYNSLYAYKYVGLTSEGNPSVYDADGKVVSLEAVRDIKALTCVGQLDPKWNGSLDIKVRWKSLNFFTKIVYYAGHSLRVDATPLYNGVSSGAVNEDIVRRWTPTNTNTDIPSMTLYGLQSERAYQWKYADYNTASASFVKVRNIGLYYDLPTEWITKIGFGAVRLRAQVNNPCYWAKNNRDIDPEAFYANSGSRSAALVTSYILGVNINF